MSQLQLSTFIVIKGLDGTGFVLFILEGVGAESRIILAMVLGLNDSGS